MTNLKTLKDFEFDSLGTSYAHLLRALRAEAVKWVKEMYKYLEPPLSAINSFKKFFNITEEDLK